MIDKRIRIRKNKQTNDFEFDQKDKIENENQKAFKKNHSIFMLLLLQLNVQDITIFDFFYQRKLEFSKIQDGPYKSFN